MPGPTVGDPGFEEQDIPIRDPRLMFLWFGSQVTRSGGRPKCPSFQEQQMERFGVFVCIHMLS